MIVVVIFWNDFFPFGRKNNLQPMGKSGVLSYVKIDKIILWLKILVACVPAAVVGILYDDKLEALFYNYQTVAISLIVFGVAFLIVESNKNRQAKIKSTEDITFKTALIIGIFQLVAAVFPGTSRSGATIIGALILGVSRTVAAEFTFFLAIPVMFGASLLKLVKFGLNFTAGELSILIIGMVTAFAVSIFAIKFLMGYIKKHDFKAFGWYRIILGIVVLLYFGVIK